MKSPLILFVFFFLLAVPNSFARKGYVPGYIIKLSGDTIHGEIKDRDLGTFEELYDRIRFVEKGKLFAKKYAPNKISGYGYEGVEFHSVRLQEKIVALKTRYFTDASSPFVFLRVVSTSTSIIHYEREFVDQDNDVIVSYSLLYSTDKTEMVRTNQGIFGLKKKRLSEYFENCPDLVDSINGGSMRYAFEIFDFYLENCSE